MQIKSDRRTHQERTEFTRAALIAAARRLFTENGYAKTGTPEIVEAANVTRGAMYHHFVDKADVFLAVAKQCAQEVADSIDAGSRDSRSPLDALMQGAQCYFAAMAQGGRARLLLLEAPSVLNVEQRLQITELTGEAQLQQGLSDALPAAAHIALPQLASLVSAAFDHAALAIAMGASPEKYQTAMHFLLSQLIRPPVEIKTSKTKPRM